MLLRSFYFLLILWVIILPTWTLWLRQPLVFCKGQVSPLNDNYETQGIFMAPIVLTFLLLFAVFGFAYPRLGIFWQLLLTVVVTAVVMSLIYRLVAIVQRKKRTHQIFARWLSGEDEGGFIYLLCGGFSRKLFMLGDHLVFSIGEAPAGRLSSAVENDLRQLYGKIHYAEGKSYARIGPRPESLKDIVRFCKTFPRAEYVMLTCDHDSFVLNL